MLIVTAWTSCGSGMWVCFGMFVMHDGALMAVKKLYIRLCAARDTYEHWILVFTRVGGDLFLLGNSDFHAFVGILFAMFPREIDF
jgi:hypothetical protein